MWYSNGSMWHYSSRILCDNIKKYNYIFQYLPLCFEDVIFQYKQFVLECHNNMEGFKHHYVALIRHDMTLCFLTINPDIIMSGYDVM